MANTRIDSTHRIEIINGQEVEVTVVSLDHDYSSMSNRDIERMKDLDALGREMRENRAVACWL